MKLTLMRRLEICFEALTARSGHKHSVQIKQLSTFLAGYDAGFKDLNFATATDGSCRITITGPAGCGKSIIMNRIAETLEGEFEATVISEDLRIERNGTNFSKIADWERETIARTTWHIFENSIPRH